MEKTITKFGNIEIKKQKFHENKRPFSIKNIEINKIVVSNKVSLGKKSFKHFIGYKDAKNVRPLCIFLPKMIAYRREFDKTKYNSFLINDNELLEKYNEICEKVKNIIKKEFDGEAVYNEKYLKAKIKSYNGKINTNFHNNKIPKKNPKFICLSVSLIDSVFRKSKSYYPQVLFEECKYVVKEKRYPSILLTI